MDSGSLIIIEAHLILFYDLDADPGDTRGNYQRLPAWRREHIPRTPEKFFRIIGVSSRVRAEITGPNLNKAGSFIAEKDGSPIGCVGLRNQPREKWHEIRYLAVKNGESRIPIAQSFVARALDSAKSSHAESLTAFVPAVQPYVDIYKSAGFKPARRSVRIAWELTEQPTEQGSVSTK